MPKKKKGSNSSSVKIRVWSLATADAKFSLFIRQRDGKCLRCGKTESLQNSHFWGRGVSAMRFNPDNCITLCYRCHYGDYQYGWEYDKAGIYRQFMIQRLGQARYDELEKEYRQSKMTRREAILQLQEFLSHAQIPRHTV